MIHLDTSFVIDLLREQSRQRLGPATAAIEARSGDTLGASVFVVCELEAGAARASNPDRGNSRSAARSLPVVGRWLRAPIVPAAAVYRAAVWRTPACGGTDATYAPIATRSSPVSFSTTGFMSCDQTPFRVPTCMSYSWRTR